MKNILYCASSTGHLRSFHLPYLTALLRAGHRVTAAAAGTADGLPEGLAFCELPFTKRFLSLRNLRASLRLAALMRRERFDLVLVHTSLAAFFTRIAVLLAGKRNTRVVNTVHGYLFGEAERSLRRNVLLAAEKLTAPVTDDILTMNDEDARIAASHRLCRGRLVPIDGMGIDSARFRPAAAEEKAAARRALSLPEDAFVLLYAAEFSARKNQRFLLESLPEDAWLLLPGRGDRLEECRTLAERLGLADRVRFPGYVSDIRTYLWAADLCVSASRSEGLPFHVMEAMSCGLPSLLPRGKGHTDLIEACQAGLLFPPEDRAAFCSSLRRLQNDPALRAAMGARARQQSARYDLAAVLPKILPYYQ